MTVTGDSKGAKRGLPEQDVADLLADIAHELRAPVSAIALLAETLGAQDLPDDVALTAARMQDESMRVAQTVEDLIELAASRTGGKPPFVETMAAGEVVDEALRRISLAAELRSVGLVLTGETDIAVQGVRNDLISALHHVIENAIQHSPQHGVVRIDVQPVDTSAATVVVEDEGAGIVSSHIEHIFERFERGDVLGRRGSGLGLSIAKSALERNDGDIRVESQPGNGSTFVISLQRG